MDRHVNFSVKPDNQEVLDMIKDLKTHCRQTGTNFSYIMCKAVALVHKEMKL